MDPDGAAVVEHRLALTGNNKESQKTFHAAVAQLGVRGLTEWGSDGTDDGQYDQPNGIAVVGSGRVDVVDTGNNRGQVLESVQWDVAVLALLLPPLLSVYVRLSHRNIAP